MWVIRVWGWCVEGVGVGVVNNCGLAHLHIGICMIIGTGAHVEHDI